MIPHSARVSAYAWVDGMQAAWFSVITMITVGYGDMTDERFGRAERGSYRFAVGGFLLTVSPGGDVLPL